MTSRRTPSPRAVWLGVAAAIIISTIGFLNGYLSERTDKETAQQGKAVAVDQATGLADKVLTACNGTGDEAAALRAAKLCGSASQTKTKVEAIPGAPGRAGATGPVGPVGPQGPGPSLRQLLQTMQLYCAPRQECRGPRGQTVVGADGQDSTVAGPQGTTGAAGKDSTVPGPKGDTGAKGDTGDRGTAGANGRGIASLVCSGGLAPITFTVTYDDGTTQTFSCGEIPPTDNPTDPTPDE